MSQVSFQHVSNVKIVMVFKLELMRLKTILRFIFLFMKIIEAGYYHLLYLSYMINVHILIRDN